MDKLVLLATAAIIFAALPLDRILTAIETVTVGLGDLLPVTIVFAALVLTASFARLVVDRPE